jgi:hypothetical protein
VPTVVRTSKKTDPAVKVAELLKEYAPLVAQVKSLEPKMAKLKTSLVEILTTSGSLDDRKSRWIELSEPVDGIRAVKHERRVSTFIDEALARRVLAKRAKLRKDEYLLEHCLQTTVVFSGSQEKVMEILDELEGVTILESSERLDQDAVMAAYARKEITAADVDAMTVESEVYAFKLISAT